MATFRKRGNSWEYRISYKDPYSKKYKIKSQSGYGTKKEAQLAAAEMEKQILEGFEIAPMSLKSFMDIWLDHQKVDLRKNTIILHERNVKKHILPYFKSINLNEIKPIMYQKFINHLCDQGYSKRTVEIIHGTMYKAFSQARVWNKIEKNPCEGVKIRVAAKSDDELKFMESDRINHFYQEAYAYGYIYWIFFKVLIETGMRKGEAAALQWTDIDLKEKTISINKTLDFQRKKDEELFGDTKTYNSRRVIGISQSLANDLHFHMKYQNQNKLALNDVYRHDLNLVLCRNDGNFMPKSSLFNAFSRILKRMDHPPLPIHSLRHTHAVLQLEAGADMKYIQERLGHGSVQITADVYSHISKKIEKDRSDKFEEHMKNILK